MKGLAENEICPRCGAGRLKTWEELSDEQRMLAARLPGSAEYSAAARKKHRYCERCWFESSGERPTAV